MMNHVKSALLSAHRPHHLVLPPPPLQMTATSSFHSSLTLQRKRKTQWHQRYSYYSKRRRNGDTKTKMFQNITDYAQHLFDSWREENEKKDASCGPSWFRSHRWVKASKNNGFPPHGFHCDNMKSEGGFDFCTSDEDEPETVFRNAFRGNQQTYYWTFSSDDFDFESSNSRHSRSKSSRQWSYETDDDDDDEISTRTDVSLARQALGLTISGPLKLEDVKSAYRTCALRWHPDRHQGSSKATAEEKFKHCSSAYKTLCDSLVTT